MDDATSSLSPPPLFFFFPSVLSILGVSKEGNCTQV